MQGSIYGENGRVFWQDDCRVLSMHAGSSPREADVAFASIASGATAGPLNAYVLRALDGDYSDWPTPAMLSDGFHVCETASGVRMVLVVTAGRRADARTLLRTNLRKALDSLGSELAGKTIWLPLMGTGSAKLPMETSLQITLEVLLEVRLGMPGRPIRVKIDMPLDLLSGTQQILYQRAEMLTVGESRSSGMDRGPATASSPVERPRARVATSGALHGDPAREQALVTLFSELFDDDGLRQWTRLTLGKDVHQALPGASVAFDDLCFRLVLQVQQRGLVNEAFFTCLTEARPAQRERILGVAELWRSGPPAQPRYLDEHTRLLGERLADAYERKRALEAVGADVSTVVPEILRLKREIRSGGQLRPGDRLGEDRYLLLDRLGRGGFANVWKALDQSSGQHVAIKVLHSELAGDVVRRARFFRGARIMAELDHPAVVRIIEPHGEDDGYLYFVMELITGGDLRQAVLERRVDGSMVVPLLLGLGEALSQAHARGFVHRDVKPANVLLTGTAQPRLTDFDLVAAQETTGGTGTGGALGTVIYVAPEMLHRPQDADARADVYGLGMTAAFILHGTDLPLTVLRDAPGFIAGLSCDEALKQLLQRAVAWEAAERFANAGEFCRALREYEQTALGIEQPEGRRPVQVERVGGRGSERTRHDDNRRSIQIGNIRGDFHASGQALNQGDIHGSATATTNIGVAPALLSQAQWQQDVKMLMGALTSAAMSDRMDALEDEVWRTIMVIFRKLRALNMDGKTEEQALATVELALDSNEKSILRRAFTEMFKSRRSILKDMGAQTIWSALFGA
jgi:hypothetical protein